MENHDPLEKDVEKAESMPMMGDDAHSNRDEGNGKKTRARQIVDIACIGLNIISTVFLVFLNKWFVSTSYLLPTQ